VKRYSKRFSISMPGICPAFPLVDNDFTEREIVSPIHDTFVPEIDDSTNLQGFAHY
jgi:hypothetical protein